MLLICYSMLYCEESTWNPLPFHCSKWNKWESTWNPPGIHLESMEWLWNIPCGIHVDNPYGLHGFQVEFGHSMWNMHGKKSPKWVGFHPKHIPYGMGGIPLECGGTVKTSLVSNCKSCEKVEALKSQKWLKKWVSFY